MTTLLTQVEEDTDGNYQLRPFGLLLIVLESEELARTACDALAAHMRKFKRAIAVDDDGLHFESGLGDEDFAIINRAIMWHDLTVPELHAKAESDLHVAVEAARRKSWARRREELLQE